MSNLANQPEHIQQRYGYKKPTLIPRLISVVLIGVTVAGATFIFLKSKDKNVDAQLKSFVVNSDTSVLVNWEIARPANTTVYCVIRAQNDQRVDVGYATVTVEKPGNLTKVNFSYALTTESKAVLAEVLGCGLTPKLRVPSANFPPGVQIPQQNPPGVAPTAP